MKVESRDGTGRWELSRHFSSIPNLSAVGLAREGAAHSRTTARILGSSYFRALTPGNDSLGNQPHACLHHSFATSLIPSSLQRDSILYYLIINGGLRRRPPLQRSAPSAAWSFWDFGLWGSPSITSIRHSQMADRLLNQWRDLKSGVASSTASSLLAGGGMRKNLPPSTLRTTQLSSSRAASKNAWFSSKLRPPLSGE